MKWYEIFKAGNYPQGDYTKKNLDELVDRFARETSGAPITLNHNKKGPAYGWVDQLKRKGDRLLATFKQVPEAFQAVIKKGLFKNVSVELAPDRDGKGERLRAVSFLGATPPAIKELDLVEFGEDEDAIYIDFKEDNRMDEEERLRIRVADLEKELQSNKDEIKTFSEAESEKDKRIEVLETGIKSQALETKEKEVKAFCEAQVEAKKVYPAEVPGITQTLMSLDSTEIKEFSEEDGKTSKKTAFDQYKEAIEGRPEVVNFGEIVTDKTDRQYDFSGSEGQTEVDSEGLVIFSEVEKEAKVRNISLYDTPKIHDLTKEVIHRRKDQ